MNVNNMIGKSGYHIDTRCTTKAASKRKETALDKQMGAIQNVKSTLSEPSTSDISSHPIRSDSIQNATLAALRRHSREQTGATENIASTQSLKDNDDSESPSLSLEQAAKKSDEEHAHEWNSLMSEEVKEKIRKSNDFEQAKAKKEGFTKQKTQLEESLEENYEFFTDRELDEIRWKIERAGLYEARVQARMDIITKPAQKIQTKAQVKASKNVKVCFAEDDNGNVTTEVRIFQSVRIIPAPITRTAMDALNIDSTQLTNEQMEQLGTALIENADNILADLSIAARVIFSLGIELVADTEQLALLALTLIELDEEPGADKLYDSARLSTSMV